MGKIYNFSAGPAVLPAPVLQRAQEEMIDYRGLGFSIMEASHRSKDFESIIEGAEANIRSLMGISDEYSVLFLQGGASSQFAMIPMNLMLPGKGADYADTGAWSSKAIKEAKLFGDVQVSCTSKETNYNQIPAFDSWQTRDDASYLHITSNNTIFGTQFADYPTAPEGVPMIADMSSDIMCRPVDVTKFGLIYAGAQKNLGPSGVTVVIIRNDLAERTPATVPSMFKYGTHIKSGSMFNTPPTFSIYILKLVTDWVLKQGGLSQIEKINQAKAKALYDVIDQSDFYTCPTASGSRSIMNVVFNLAGETLEAKFLAEAKNEGLVGLKGHRSVGGIRASIYNAMPPEGVHALVQFMKAFRLRHG